MAKKERIDKLLVVLGLAEDVTEAQHLILAGEVLVDGQVWNKSGMTVPVASEITLKEKRAYVGRGALKLAHALETFELNVSGLIAIDVGASIGGFTDLLLRKGAGRVYAIDVGYGQLDWRIRQDPRVVVLERINIRYLDSLPSGVLADCGVADVSFISLRLVLPAMTRLLTPKAWVVALVKPQFEAKRSQVEKGGVVRLPIVHREVLEAVLEFAISVGLHPQGLVRSPLIGPAGNVEFLVLLQKFDVKRFDIQSAINQVVYPLPKSDIQNDRGRG